MLKSFLSIVIIVGFTSTLSLAAVKKSVSFVSPKDGAEVSSPFKAKFAETGMTLTPAGKDVDDKTKGHFHLIVDAKGGAEGEVIPADATHLHYGKGQTESDNLTLAPGKHTLTLQLADGLHRAYGANLTKTITITVK